MNAANFARLIACLESDWAQTQPTTAFKLAVRLKEKDGALSVADWLGVGRPAGDQINVILINNLPWPDTRDRFKRIAKELRGWCAANNIEIQEKAA